MNKTNNTINDRLKSWWVLSAREVKRDIIIAVVVATLLTAWAIYWKIEVLGGF